MKKSAKFFGKSLLALALGIIAVVGLGIAGLLSYYGKFIGTTAVTQSVQVSLEESGWKQCTGSPPECELTFIVEGVAGDTITQNVYLKNEAQVNANIELQTECPEGFPNKNEVSPGQQVECKTNDGKLGLTVTYSLKDTGGNEVNPGDNGVYTLSKDNSPYTLTIDYTFAINAAPGNYQITTTVVPV